MVISHIIQYWQEHSSDKSSGCDSLDFWEDGILFILKNTCIDYFFCWHAYNTPFSYNLHENQKFIQ